MYSILNSIDLYFIPQLIQNFSYKILDSVYSRFRTKLILSPDYILDLILDLVLDNTSCIFWLMFYYALLFVNPY